MRRPMSSLDVPYPDHTRRSSAQRAGRTDPAPGEARRPDRRGPWVPRTPGIRAWPAEKLSEVLNRVQIRNVASPTEV
jgi:hypothetical protein